MLELLIFRRLPYVALALAAVGLAALALRRNPSAAPKASWPDRLVSALFLHELRRKNVVLWLVAAAFHLSLAVLIVWHLRFFLDPIPPWLVDFRSSARAAGYVLPLAALGLLLRRTAFKNPDRSTGGGVLLALAAFLGVSGLFLRRTAPVDLTAVKNLGLGLVRLDPPPSFESDSVWLTVHFLAALILAAWLPWAKRARRNTSRDRAFDRNGR